MLNIRKFLNGISLVPKTTLVSDTKGELEVLTSDGKLYYHNGTTRSPAVTEAHSATLTNKTIVVANNTVTTAASGNLSATELNAALAELQTDIDTRATQTALDAHINDTTDAHDASAISVVPTGNLAADDVQEALGELQGDIDTINTSLATKVTGEASSVDGEVALFEGTSGKDIKRATGTGFAKLTSGVLSTSASVSLTTEVTGILPLANGGTNKNLTPVAGGIVYTDGDSLEVTAAGTSGQVLQSNGVSAPTWVTPNAGTVSGPGSSTDNALARFDGTTGLVIQNSVGILSDAGILSGLTGVTTSGILTASEQFALTGDTTNSQTGSSVNITNTATVVTRLTSGSLVSVGGYADATAGRKIILINQTGVTQLIKNEDTSITATNRIKTGRDTDIFLLPNASVELIYNATVQRWMVLGYQSTPQFIMATGGTITTDGNFKVHSFTTSGTFTITAAPSTATVEYLVIGGGGGGAGNLGGGGGAGAYRTASGFAVTPQAYSITVGAGGAAGGPGVGAGSNGGASTFSTITSDGGGGGGSSAPSAPPSPGNASGGGGAFGLSGATGGTFGNNGGSSTGSSNFGAGGGGGAGAVGGNGTTSVGGAGGAGLSSSITGSAVTRAGGGGGGINNTGAGAGGTGGGGAGSAALNGTATAGTANTGSGGGGGGNGSSTGGIGGSGIVIIRYQYQ